MKWDEVTPEEVIGVVGGGAFGIPMLVYFIKKLFVSFVQNDKAIASAEAETDVIGMLRIEVTRLSEINIALAKALNDLQRENMGLKQEISTLHTTINDMAEQLNMIKRRKISHPFYGEDRRRHNTDEG